MHSSNLLPRDSLINFVDFRPGLGRLVSGIEMAAFMMAHVECFSADGLSKTLK